MKNKIFLMSIGLSLFIVSVLGGYFGPKAYMAWRSDQARAAFVPGAVPKLQVQGFAAHFNDVKLATEPQYLPDTSLEAPSGKTVRVADFKGKPTLVNIWGTWCAPCVVELPSLEKLARHYKGRLNVVAIALERGKTPSEITAFLEKRGIGAFAANVDKSGDFAKNLGVRGLPTSFLIGSNGLILYRFEGDADWAGPESQSFFDTFLLTTP